MPDINISQLPEIIVSTDTAAKVETSQLPEIVVSKQPVDIELSQFVRVVVTKLFVPGNNSSCRVSVST